jgi:hypothetical protein
MYFLAVRSVPALSCILYGCTTGGIWTDFADFLTWLAQGDVDFCFLLVFVRKSIAVEEEMT